MTKTDHRKKATVVVQDQLAEILPKVLPADPSDAITGSDLYAKIKDNIVGGYSENTVRQWFSLLSQDPGSVLAKKAGGHGYYLRPAEKRATAFGDEKLATPSVDETAEPEDVSGRDVQREEKFRALFIRLAELNGEFPLHIEHTEGARRISGQNKWKFPDVILLEWDKGIRQLDEKAVAGGAFKLNKQLLDVKKALGEQPFKLTSVELKVDISFAILREYFFQCVSNSSWAHKSQLAIATEVTDKSLSDELGRLGSSFGVTIMSYGLKVTDIDAMPNAEELRKSAASQIEVIGEKIRPTTISSGQERNVLDWEHIGDMRRQHIKFEKLFGWIASSLEHAKAYTYQQYTDTVA